MGSAGEVDITVGRGSFNTHLASMSALLPMSIITMSGLPFCMRRYSRRGG